MGLFQMSLQIYGLLAIPKKLLSNFLACNFNALLAIMLVKPQNYLKNEGKIERQYKRA